MKKLYFLASMFLSAVCVNAQYTVASGSTSAADLGVVGGYQTYRLTTATNNQAGAIWKAQSFASDFMIHGELNFGNQSTQIGRDAYTSGADGIAFVVQAAGLNALGGIGEGIGYEGLTNSLALEMDTWQNLGQLGATATTDAYYSGGNKNDPAADHMAFMTGGSAVHNSAPMSLPIDLEDGMWHDFVAQWNSTTKVLTVTLDGTYTINYSGDVAALLGGSNLYIGFTAATGGAVNEHQVRFAVASGCTSNIIYCGNKKDVEKKVMVCHIPPGNPGNRHAICVSWSAVPAHLAHGDCLGDCSGTAGAGLMAPGTDVAAGPVEDGANMPAVYPNPSKGQVQVRMDHPTVEKAELVVVNARGSVVEKRSINASQTLSLDLKRYGTGLYLVKIYNGSDVQTTKVVVQQ